MKPNDILPDYPVWDFSGGLRTDKGNSQLKDNELAFVNNVDILPGKIFKRYGSIFFGGFQTGYPGASELFETGIYNKSLNSGAGVQLLANKNSSGDGGMIYKLVAEAYFSTYSAGTLNISGQTTNYASAGTIEVEGDIVTYTGLTPSSFTGVTGITTSPTHTTGALIKQWKPALSGAFTTSNGVGFAYLNGFLIVSLPNIAFWKWAGTGNIDSSSITYVSSAYPLYVTTYKQRVYGVDYTNQSQIYFSELNDGATWTGGTTGNFIVEDDVGEVITGLRNYKGHLMIFKANSIWYYNLSVLAELNNQIGIYNNRCHTEINNLLYVFGPKGAYASIGRYLQFKDIGQPVKKWLDAFNAAQNTSTSSGNTSGAFPNCARFNNKWLIYIGDITIDQKTYSDVTLVYDTIYHYWSVWSGFTNLQGWINTSGYFGDGGIGRNQLFFTDDAQGIYQMFDNTSQRTGTLPIPAAVGGFQYQDRFKDTGTKIPSEVITKMYGLRTIGWWKQFRYLRLYCDSWPFDLDVRTLTKTGYSNWKSLGQVRGPESVLKVDLEGYAIQLRFVESSGNAPWSVLGFVFEQTQLLSQWHN